MAEKKQYSILELPLITEPWQKDIIDTKMDCVRRVYNSMLSKELKRYNEMIKTREWRSLNEIIKEELQKAEAENSKKKSDVLKAAYDRKNEIMRENSFSDFDFRSKAIVYSKYYQKHVSSKMAMVNVGQPMWAAFEKLFFGNGEKVAFKKYDEVTTIASDNKSGIRLMQDDNGKYYVLISNKAAKAKPVKLYIKGPNTTYDKEMLTAKIKVVRVIKKIEKGDRKYYCQLTVERTPFIKMDKEGNPKHQIGVGKVGIAIWRNTLCAVSDKKVYKINLSPNAEEFAIKREELSRKLEYIRRINNPDNYNEDGTIKKGIWGEDKKLHKLHWTYTNHYKKVKAELRELYRKHTVEKILLQNETVWKLLSMGNEFCYVDISFLTTKPEWNEEEPLTNAEYRKKKQRRRAIQENAPSMILTKLDRKLINYNLMPITRYTLPEDLYWYHHGVGISNKDLFPGENILVEGRIINHTIYRAFLIRHFENGMYNRDTLIKDWSSFVDKL